MNNSLKSISQTLAIGAAGVAFFQLANSSIVAALPVETLTVIAISVALIAGAAADYARSFRRLPAAVRASRPALPLATTPSISCTGKSRHHDCLAA